jgi:GlpG protein
MRQIATLPDGDAARAFADYLLTLQIETRLEHEPGGWALWVCDEDRVGQARQELAEFQSNPADRRYRRAARTAAGLRRQETQREESYRRKQDQFRERMADPAAGPRAVTVALIVLSVAVFLAYNLGDLREPVLSWLSIASYEQVDRGGVAYITWARLEEVRHGQVWRLATPMFVHFGPAHLLFNMIMLLYLGGQIEARRGSPRFLLLALVLSVCSNLAQYYLGRTTFQGLRPQLQPSPAFGGMSGVLYGLFGYLWMKSLFEPERRMTISHNVVVILLVCFFLCWSGLLAHLIGPVANVAHTAGLLAGLAIGYAPTLWRSLRERGASGKEARGGRKPPD